jgi:glycosyltransferase involved in cell wall biosynthesis
MSMPVSAGANEPSEQPDRLRVGWFSTWNSKCGIAEYSKFLLAELNYQRFDCTVIAPINELRIAADEVGVIRCWSTISGEVAPLLKVLEEQKFDIFVMQYKLQAHFGWLSLQQLEAVIACCLTLGTKVVIFLHSTDGADYWGNPVSLTRIKYSLASVHRVLVHSMQDLERMRAFGVDSNVSLIPHGLPENPNSDRQAARLAHGLPENGFIIGSYGFLLPHKGIDKLIEALPLLHASGIPAKLLLINALYPLPMSQEHLSKCERLIVELGMQKEVILETRFLPNEVSLEYLVACDCIVFPYQQAEDSSSAALRMGIAAHRPVLCSPKPIFSDVANVTYFLPGCESYDISNGLQTFLQDFDGRERLAAQQEDWLDRHSWRTVGRLLSEMLEELAVSSDLEPTRVKWVGKLMANMVTHEELLKLELQHNTQQIADLNARIADQASTAAALNKRIAEMAATESALNRRVADLELTVKKWEHVADIRRAELNELYASTSWKVTRPLRFCSLSIKEFPSNARRFRSYLASRLRSSASETAASVEPTKALQIELSPQQQSIFLDLKHAGAQQQ